MTISAITGLVILTKLTSSIFIMFLMTLIAMRFMIIRPPRHQRLFFRRSRAALPVHAGPVNCVDLVSDLIAFAIIGDGLSASRQVAIVIHDQIAARR